MSEEINFTPHSIKQDDLIFSSLDLTIAGTGTQWGKSSGGALWLKNQIHEFTDPQDNFLMMAPTYKVMQQSMLPYFLYYMEGLGEYRKADSEFELFGGGKVYMRTGTDPNSIVGIPKVRAYWLDEAGLATLYFWENIQARAAAVGARGLLTTSPYSRNWIWKDYVKPILDGKMTDVKLIRAASWENPYHTLSDPAKRDAMRTKMDPRRFSMVFGGEWGQMAGLVYDCFDEDQNIVEPFELPTGTRYYAGIDWGFTDPFVLVVRAITPDGRHYRVSEFYKSRLTLPDQIAVAKQKKEVYGIQKFFCGPDQPGSIEEFNRNGLAAEGADNDRRRGIDLHYELIKSRRYKFFRNTSPYTMDELQTYHYPDPEDLGPDDNAKEELPVEQNDHALDADRYLTIMTYRTDQKKSPKSPGEAKPHESHQKRIERLKRGRMDKAHSESWS